MPAHDDTTAAPNDARDHDREDQRELLLMRAGRLRFAVYAAEVESVAQWTRPAPLPHAPAAVLGVVPARGRMRTVLDPAQLLREAAGEGGEGGGHTTGELAGGEAAYDFVACLRGDEQLALAFESAERAHLGGGELRAPGGPADLPARGCFERGGGLVFLLDPAKIFAAAMRGTERRRTRRAP